MTKLIFGTWQIGGTPSFKDCSEETACKILEYAYKKGVQIFDTAPIYGLGKSEKLLGKFLQGKRKKIQIISKFGFDWGEDKNTFIDFSPAGIKMQLEKSLDRLQTSYLDIYLLHVPQAGISPQEILTTLNSLKKSGKIKSYGVCNMGGIQLQSFLEHPLSEIEYIQDFYNILDRNAEKNIFPYMKAQQRFLAYSPLYRGVMTSLSMKELLEKDEDALNMLLKNQDLPRIYKQKLLYDAVCKQKNTTPEKLALGFLQNSSYTYSIIFGTKNIKHLDTVLNIMSFENA